MTNSDKKPSKAQVIREFQAANPKATPKEVAAGVGCDITYVYLVNSSDRNKNKKKAKKPVVKVDVTRGQEILRQELLEKDKVIEKLRALVDGALADSSNMTEEIYRLNVVIDWLEGRLCGTSV